MVSESVESAVQEWKNGNVQAVDQFLSECESYELVQFGYQIEQNDIDFYDVIEAIDRDNAPASMAVLQALDALKADDMDKMMDCWNQMELEETITFGAYICRCEYDLQKVVNMLNRR